MKTDPELCLLCRSPQTAASARQLLSVDRDYLHPNLSAALCSLASEEQKNVENNFTDGQLLISD